MPYPTFLNKIFTFYGYHWLFFICFTITYTIITTFSSIISQSKGIACPSSFGRYLLQLHRDLRTIFLQHLMVLVLWSYHRCPTSIWECLVLSRAPYQALPLLQFVEVFSIHLLKLRTRWKALSTPTSKVFHPPRRGVVAYSCIFFFHLLQHSPSSYILIFLYFFLSPMRLVVALLFVLSS